MIRKIYVIQIVSVHHYLNLCGDINVLREGPVPSTFDVNYCIISRGTLKTIMTAKIVNIEFQLTSFAGIVRYVEEGVYLMIYVFNIIE